MKSFIAKPIIVARSPVETKILVTGFWKINPTIKAITDSAREVQSIYFNPLISGSHPNKDIQSFPSGSNFIYEEQDNKFIRIANKKIYITEKDQVLTTSETGTVISVD